MLDTLGNVERAALDMLAKRDERGEPRAWHVDELPDGIDADILTLLDREHLVLARGVYWLNQQQQPGGPVVWTPHVLPWASPVYEEFQVGPWRGVLARRDREPGGSGYCDVKVSDIGFAELASLKRKAAPPLGTPDARPAAAPPTVKLPNLGPHDRQAYQLSLVLKGQQEVADALNREHGTMYGQGQASKMIGRAKRHAELSGLADLTPKPAKPATSIDPAQLELGARTDGRSRDQRGRRDPDSD
jgi:hypothetical protein